MKVKDNEKLINNDNINDIVQKLLKSDPSVKAVALANNSGLPLASSLKQEKVEVKVAAMIPIIINLARRLCIASEIEFFKSLYVKNTEGFMMIAKIDPNYSIAVSTDEYIMLESLYSKCKKNLGNFKLIEKKFNFRKRINDLNEDFGDIFLPVESIIKDIQFEKDLLRKIDSELSSDSLYYNFGEWFIKIPEIKGLQLISIQGVPIQSDFLEEMDEIRFAAMTSLLLSLIKKTKAERGKNKIDMILIESSDGDLLIQSLDSKAFLIVITEKNAPLGLICLELRKLYNYSIRSDDGEEFPFPFIFKPPNPPDDIAPVGQPQKKQSDFEIELDAERICKHCGAELPPGETVCHVCGKKT
ncbi:MAG: roadblock/LC7 domain-containing protein [Promethearchaeota archaeon]